MNTKEIEVRFLEVDKPSLVSKLLKLGAHDEGEIMLEETIIYDPDGDITELKLIDPADYKKYFDWGKIGDHIMQRALDWDNKTAEPFGFRSVQA